MQTQHFKAANQLRSMEEDRKDACHRHRSSRGKNVGQEQRLDGLVLWKSVGVDLLLRKIGAEGWVEGLGFGAGLMLRTIGAEGWVEGLGFGAGLMLRTIGAEGWVEGLGFGAGLMLRTIGAEGWTDLVSDQQLCIILCLDFFGSLDEIRVRVISPANQNGELQICPT